MDARFLTAVHPVVDREDLAVDSAPREVLRDNILLGAVPCTQHAASPVVALQEPVQASVRLVQALDSAQVVQEAAQVVRVQEEWALQGWFRLQVTLRVRSVQVARHGVVVRPTKRVKKVR